MSNIEKCRDAIWKGIKAKNYTTSSFKAHRTSLTRLKKGKGYLSTFCDVMDELDIEITFTMKKL